MCPREDTPLLDSIKSITFSVFGSFALESKKTHFCIKNENVSVQKWHDGSEQLNGCIEANCRIIGTN